MRTLGAISIHDIPNDVVLCKPAEAGKGNLDEGDFASYNEESCKAFLNENKVKTPEKAKDIICHETVHALIEITGAITYLKEMTGLDGEAFQKFEENLVGYLGPALSSCVDSLHKVTNLRMLARALKAVQVSQ